MTNTALNIEINSLPKALREEVADFVAFLKTKNKSNKQIKQREFGFAKGKIQLSKDFDEPLDIFKDYILWLFFSTHILFFGLSPVTNSCQKK